MIRSSELFCTKQSNECKNSKLCTVAYTVLECTCTLVFEVRAYRTWTWVILPQCMRMERKNRQQCMPKTPEYLRHCTLHSRINITVSKVVSFQSQKKMLINNELSYLADCNCNNSAFWQPLKKAYHYCWYNLIPDRTGGSQSTSCIVPE